MEVEISVTTAVPFCFIIGFDTETTTSPSSFNDFSSKIAPKSVPFTGITWVLYSKCSIFNAKLLCLDVFISSKTPSSLLIAPFTNVESGRANKIIFASETARLVVASISFPLNVFCPKLNEQNNSNTVKMVKFFILNMFLICYWLFSILTSPFSVILATPPLLMFIHLLLLISSTESSSAVLVIYFP